jgi:hypothetical protein
MCKTGYTERSYVLYGMVSLKNKDAYIVDLSQLAALAAWVQSAKTFGSTLAFRKGLPNVTNIQVRAIVTTPSSNGWYITSNI